MITLSKSGGTVTFTFDGNSTYLQNGTIEVPLNSLSLIVDESGMATFRKSASNDIFVSALYSEFGMSKAELEEWYKENMVGSAGIDSGAVQTMIDESISGKADTSALTVYFDDVEYDSSAKTINFYNDGVLKDSIDASDFVIDGMVDDVRIETISGDSYLIIDFNTASGKEDIQIPLSDIFNPDNYYDKTAIDGIVSGLNEDIATKLDASAYTPTDLSQYWTSAQTESAITEAVSGKADTSAVTAIQDSLSGYVETSAITTSVTSASTDSEIPTAKAVWEAASGGGKAIEAGRGISITTGETADTVSFSLPISAGTGTNSIAEGDRTTASGNYSHAEGRKTIASGTSSHAEGESTKANGQDSHAEGNNTTASGVSSHAEGRSTTANGVASHAEGRSTTASGESSHAEGYYSIANNQSEHASGRYNISSSASTTFGDSGNTLFSVGNGTSNNARHNAFEIRQNGDIYCSDGTNDVKLQDTITATAANTTALGGLKLVKLSQSEYDALTTKDNSTLYVIVN